MTRLGVEDAGELLTLQRAAWVQEAQANGDLFIPPLTQTLEDVRADLADPAWTVWGARDGHRLVGTVRTTVLADGTGYLGRLGVAPDRQGTGLGSVLLAHALAALPPSVRTVLLVTGPRSADNHVFYERRGWVRDDTQPHPQGTAAYRLDR